jgi:hypothetical protein
LQKSV